MSDAEKLALVFGVIISTVVLIQIYFAVSFWFFKRNRFAGLEQRTRARQARKTERIKSTHRKRPY